MQIKDILKEIKNRRIELILKDQNEFLNGFEWLELDLLEKFIVTAGDSYI